MKITKKLDFLDYNDTIILKFWSEKCPPCRDLDEKLQKLENEKIDNLSVLKVDIDENIEIMSDLITREVITPFMSIPTTFVYKNGKLVNWPIIWSKIEEIKESI